MKQIETLLCVIGCSFLLTNSIAFAQMKRLPDEATYSLLHTVADVKKPVILLSGTW